MEERRKNNVDFEVYIQKFNDFIDGTNIYREKQEAKQDCIRDTINIIKESILKLPCGARNERTNSMARELNWIRGFLGAIILAMAGYVWFKK